MTNNVDHQTSDQNEIIIYSHSTLFYWWPAWLFGFLFAIIGALTDSARGASERTHSTLGLIYILILLLLVVVTNVRLRGIRSIAVLLALALVAVTLAWFNLWDRILNVIPYLSVNVDTNFYLVFSAALFLIWLAMFFVFDRLTYWRIRPGQLTVEHRIGGGAESFDTNALRFHKLSSDFFRAVLGLGTGDLRITGVNAPETTTYLANVVFAGRKVQAIEKLIVVKPDVVT
jgi:hypothetical protein